MINLNEHDLYLVNSPFWLQWFYPTLTWHKDRKEKYVYLTFDDGPIPVVTPFVLNTLKNFNAQATFFCIGNNVKNNPAIYRDILSNGHTVGNHTFSHLNGWKSQDTVYLLDIEKCAGLVKSNLFRPPYGRIKNSQIRKMKITFSKMKIIMWDVLSGDFDPTISGERCAKNVIDNAKNGSIIVFHDSDKAFSRLEYALPLVLKHLQAQGYEFKML